jgi:hypothetical protein
MSQYRFQHRIERIRSQGLYGREGQGQKVVLPFLCIFEPEVVSSGSNLGAKTHRCNKVSTPSSNHLLISFTKIYIVQLLKALFKSFIYGNISNYI